MSRAKDVIRPEILSMGAYHVADATGLVKLDVMESPYRLPEALDVATRISRYGGAVVVLIHPNILDHKLAFEQGFVEAVRPYAWFGSVGQFGRWWAARNRVQLDCAEEPAGLRLSLTAPEPLEGLTLVGTHAIAMVPAAAK